ncbi:hypothetical protein GGX14DRAFT_396688 [Mycena pura]|uniref:Uncharacterized protein n=1 Tax=Mycena pura TaxID=153505 RepID=A0AAD6VDK2_9AGAR|nr:hypothetical protein GGX14DRAFT_396688 [Mycena pura]
MLSQPIVDRLAHSAVIAQQLRTLCETTPDMSLYQPVATSAVETTELLIIARNISPDISGLGVFESTLDSIRQHIEGAPARSRKKLGRFSMHPSSTQSSRLATELRRQMKALLQTSKPFSSSRSEIALEVATLTTRASLAVCDAPVINFLKPVVGIATIICDTAKTVKSNREAALDLAKHASDITKCVVDHVSKTAPPTNNNHALETLKSALQDASGYLIFLKKRRHRMKSWILANQAKDRFMQLNLALDKALALFSTDTAVSTNDTVRSNTRQLTTLVDSVRRQDHEMDRKLTTIHENLNRLSEKAPNSYCTIPFNSTVMRHLERAPPDENSIELRQPESWLEKLYSRLYSCRLSSTISQAPVKHQWLGSILCTLQMAV